MSEAGNSEKFGNPEIQSPFSSLGHRRLPTPPLPGDGHKSRDIDGRPSIKVDGVTVKEIFILKVV